jgi:hypothetical protein
LDGVADELLSVSAESPPQAATSNDAAHSVANSAARRVFR